ncbi:MAG: response regulator [Nocardioidaceae bacterium]|nr:response regulator [Nocardioidaceae bacterium]NUS51947.1 response regulator [Nocardioidaceae bacterium]
MSTVAIAEDDRDIRELVELILGEEGYATVAVPDGHSALEMCRRERPDLLLLDVSMPGELSGLEVCRRIRSDEQIGGLPIMLLTARARDQDINAGYAAGADDYLVKPFNPLELSRRVRALVEPTD